MTTKSKFIQKVVQYTEFTDTCWKWKGTTPNGYGQLLWRGKKWRVHRLAYAFWVGKLIDGQDIHHTCKTKNCLNPDHLVQMTKSDHKKLEMSEKTWKPRHCSKGHYVTPKNCYWDNGYMRCSECARQNKRLKAV